MEVKMAVNSFKDLKVWQKSMDLAIMIYKLVKLLPREELFSLSDQMRRSVVSIPSNIAEGQQRNSCLKSRAADSYSFEGLFNVIILFILPAALSLYDP